MDQSSKTRNQPDAGRGKWVKPSVLGAWGRRLRTWFGFPVFLESAPLLLSSPEKTYTPLLSASREMLWTLDANGCFRTLEGAFGPLTGWNPEDWIGRHFLQLCHSEHERACSDLIKRALLGESPPPRETRLRLASGAYLETSVTFAPYVSQGRIEGVIGIGRDVSDYRRLDEKKRVSDARYLDLLENAHDLIYLVGIDHRFIYANRAFRDTLGYSHEELAALPPGGLLAKKDDFDSALLQRVMRGESVYHIELTLRARDGHEVYVEGSSSCRFEGDQAREICGIFRDVTERRRAERERRNATLLLEGIVQGATDAIFVKNRDGVYLMMNEAGARMVNRTVPEVIGKTDPELFDEATHQRIRAIDEEVMRTGEPQTNDHDYRTVGGVETVLFTLKAPYRDAEGNILGILGIAREFTERRRMAEEMERLVELRTRAAQERALALETAERTLRKQALILEKLSEGVHVADEKGWLIYVNSAFAAMFGYQADELVGRHVSVLNDYPEEENVHFIREGMERLQREGAWNGEICNRRKDGSRFFTHANITRTEICGTHYNIGVQENITERKRIDDELRLTAQKLERSNEELERFAFIASHDLREPLRMIRMYLSLLSTESSESLGPTAQEYLDFAVKGSERMTRLVEGLLDYSRVQTRRPQLRPVDTDVIVREVLKDLQMPITEARAEIRQARLPSVPADPTLLRQLFQNLLSNALKFRGATRPEISIDCSRAKNEWVFRISDNGIGLEMQFARRIFEVFQRLHGPGEFEGSGIGLATCKKIVEFHGGRIWVESEPGRGSSFYFALPEAFAKSAIGVTSSSPLTDEGPQSAHA